jgi:MFS family permease
MAVLTLAFAAVDAEWQVFAVRFVQGAIGASFYTASAAMATDLAPPDKQASAVARLSLALYTGFVIGPWIGERLFDPDGPRLWLVVAAMHALAAVAAWFVPESAPTRSANEPVVRSALIPRAVVAPGLVLLAGSMGYTAVQAFATDYARLTGWSDAGPMLAVFSGTIFFVRTLAGRLSDRLGPIAVSLPGVLVASVGFVVLAVSRWHWGTLIGTALVGLGWGVVFPSLTAFAVSRVDPRVRASALGGFLAFNDLGNAGGGPLVGAAIDWQGYGLGFAIPAVALVAVAGVLEWLRRTAVPSARQPGVAAT